MENSKCKICNSVSRPIFKTRILDKYDVQYFECQTCGFLQTERPYWLEEAYKNPINISDTGIVLRNQRLSRIVTSLIIIFFERKEKFLDYAGGFGLFTRLMRDIGFDFYWFDPYTKNELARGFEKRVGEKYHVTTSFESFEHFENPIEELQRIIDFSDNIIISTELVPNPTPTPQAWWYYGTEHGQHISLFTKKALETLSTKFSLHCYTIDNVHIITRKPLKGLRLLLVRIPYIKYGLYAASFIFIPFIKSRTISDMNRYKDLN